MIENEKERIPDPHMTPRVVTPRVVTDRVAPYFTARAVDVKGIPTGPKCIEGAYCRFFNKNCTHCDLFEKYTVEGEKVEECHALSEGEQALKIYFMAFESQYRKGSFALVIEDHSSVLTVFNQREELCRKYITETLQEKVQGEEKFTVTSFSKL